MPPMAENAQLRFIKSPAPPPGESPPVFELALEEALFRFFEREGGPPALRLWRPRSLCVVLGTGRPAARDVKLPLCREEGVPVLRRFSGGGTVVHSPGQLCFSFFLPFALHPSLRTVEGSYRFVFSLVGRALSALGVEGLAFREPCDFALDDRKVSGNAQRRGRRFLLHHGTLLVDCDPAPLGRFLNEPDEAPAYRRGRSHRDFLTTLKNRGYNTNVEETASAFRRALCGAEAPFEIPDCVVQKAVGLAREKYALDAWTFRR